MKPTGWRTRIVDHGEEAPDQLLANPRNWRVHPQAQQDALTGVLDQVGWVQDVIVNRRSGYLVDGHLRVAAAISRGEAVVPVVYVDLAPEEEALVLAALDPLAGMAVADADALRALLAEVTVDDAALLAMFRELAPAERRVGLTDPDSVPEPAETPYAQRGELYALGEHRLLCGDATEPADIERIMAGARADLVWTDPPYGVAVASRVGTRARSSAEARAEGGAGIRNDDVDATALEALLRKAFVHTLAATRPGAAWYVTAPHGPIGLAFSLVLAELGVWRHSLIWVKDSLVLSRMDFHYRHEPIYYGWTPGGAHHAVQSRDQDSVWEIPRPKRSLEHPTMKPVELVQRALENSSDPGELVFDPFVGSGTTIIASEITGRRCYALEIEPRYAQVSIERWEAFSGQQAERIG